MNQLCLFLIQFVSFALCLVTFWEFPWTNIAYRNVSFCMMQPKSSPYLCSLLTQIKSEWCVAFFFQLKGQGKVEKCSDFNRSAQCNPACHTLWSLTLEKGHWKFQKTKYSWDQASRNNSTEKENIIWCLFWQYFENLYLGTFENKLFSENVW